MTQQRFDKLQGHTDLLLSAFLGLRLNYGLLKPLLGDLDAQLTVPHHRTIQNGLSAIRTTLFFSCVLDVVKLSWDTDARTPSIANLVAALGEPRVVDLIVAKHAGTFVLPREKGDEEHEADLRQIEQRYSEERGNRVRKQIEEVSAKWSTFEALQSKSAFLKMRDKYIAHLEVHLSGDAYAPIDIGELGVKRGDLAVAIGQMAPIVTLLNAIYRDADFRIERAGTSFDRHAEKMWSRISS